MAFTIKNPPEFTTEVEQWTRETDADGAEMAKVVEKLLNNEVFLKTLLEALDGNAVKVGDKGVAGGVAELGEDRKLVQHVEYDHVDNVPAPKWSEIENKPTSYPPSSHSHTKKEVGLDKVDNTADKDKSVKYATNADTLDDKHASAFALASHSHSAATQSAAGLMSAADKKKLDGVAASANAYSHPTSAGNKHIPAGGSSGQILRWSSDGTAAWGSDNNTTYSAATQSANGLMSAADKKKLDGIAASANAYSHPTSAGNKHIPAGGSSGQILRWSAAGTAAWGADNNTTYSNMGAATASAAGKAGLVPAPAAGAQGKFLRGDGTWQTPTNTTYSAATTSAAGLMSAADKTKLNGIATGANVTPSGLSSGYVRTGQKSGSTIGNNATAAGVNCIASALAAVAYGYGSEATGECSFAVGAGGKAKGTYSVCLSSGGKAEGEYSMTAGCETSASYYASAAFGHKTYTTDAYGIVCGHYNADSAGYFLIGNGSESVPSNAFRVKDNGTTYAKGNYNTSGADYAEYFEWEDSNQNNEDRRGYFVTMEEDKIKKASAKDNYILGVISGKPSVIGNSDPDDWHGHFLCDEFGEFIMEKVIEKRKIHHMEEIEETYLDKDGIEQVRIVPKMVEDYEEVEVDSYVLNPDYNPDKPYTPRAERKEWAAVGMLGVLIVRDDGTCKVNEYCKVADGGIATASEIPGWRVINRVNDHLVKIIFR